MVVSRVILMGLKLNWEAVSRARFHRPSLPWIVQPTQSHYTNRSDYFRCKLVVNMGKSGSAWSTEGMWPCAGAVISVRKALSHGTFSTALCCPDADNFCKTLPLTHKISPLVLYSLWDQLILNATQPTGPSSVHIVLSPPASSSMDSKTSINLETSQLNASILL